MTDDELRFALSTLRRGGVVAAATETFFGLLADARLPRAIDAVFDLKGRSAAKGVALLLPNRDAWLSLVPEVPELAARLADHFWPGPLTIVLPARPGLDPRLRTDGTVAVRWPSASDAARIAEAFGAPLTATSANRAGEPPCVTSDEVRSAFHESTGEELAIVPGRAPGGEASTVVTVVGEGLRIVRDGPIRESDLAPLVRASP